MSGERDLSHLLSAMNPVPHPGRFVFVSVPGPVPEGLHPVVTVTEAEGTTLVVPQETADRHQLRYDFVAGWITLTVYSALDAIGLTAAVSTALARVGISCNMVAGFHHDHVFVPFGDTSRAIDVLRGLGGR